MKLDGEEYKVIVLCGCKGCYGILICLVYY